MSSITADVDNESDVEQKVLYPLLTGAAYLGIPERAIKTKQYMAPTELDKKAGKQGGYFPDYSVWAAGLPILIVEAKDPSVPSEVGFREARLYAQALNAKYPTGLNPCHFVLSCNGVRLLAGYWDQDAPVLDALVSHLTPGTSVCSALLGFCHHDVILGAAQIDAQKLRPQKVSRPFQQAGGQALLYAKLPVNSFAAGLAPVLREYFSSKTTHNVKEIAQKAYVSSGEITAYDNVLESLLKDRLSLHKDTPVVQLRTAKNDEPTLTKAIEAYRGSDPAQRGGHLQIIQGSVGAGKSLFARRYRDLLEPKVLTDLNRWAFIDFNTSPAAIKGSEKWLCESFVTSFEIENKGFDIYEPSTLKGIFSDKIQKKRGYYEQLRAVSREKEAIAKAEDIAHWQDDALELSTGLAKYIQGKKRQSLIVVMDNVDKLDLVNQLDAFQMTLWFMERTKAFVILQMRDETYERYKNRPPLDTFRSGIAFHISPPRFIDVVKRRLELAIDFLRHNPPEAQSYDLDNGMRVKLKEEDFGEFLMMLYKTIFERRGNVARVLEALAGRDVRKALEMFVSIVTSGHITTTAITSEVKGGVSFLYRSIIL